MKISAIKDGGSPSRSHSANQTVKVDKEEEAIKSDLIISVN